MPQSTMLSWQNAGTSSRTSVNNFANSVYQPLAAFAQQNSTTFGTTGSNLFTGKGAFGRTPVAPTSVDRWSRLPKSTMDQMVLDAAKQGKGQKIINSLNDPQFKGMEKWSYGETSGLGFRSEVHYVRDPATEKLLDFKFKHHAETYR